MKEIFHKIWIVIDDFFFYWGRLIAYGIFFLFLIFLFIIGSRECKRQNKNEVYHNEKLVIIETNSGDGFTQDKFHKPINVKLWLVRRVKDTTDYAELSSTYDGNSPQNFRITPELWYSKKVGDVLYFDQIRKDRFFKIHK